MSTKDGNRELIEALASVVINLYLSTSINNRAVIGFLKRFANSEESKDSFKELQKKLIEIDDQLSKSIDNLSEVSKKVTEDERSNQP